jgi:hypothetical protein
MTKRELERQLRDVHPYREHSRRQRQSLERTRRQIRALVGVLFGLGLVALLGAVHLATELRPEVAGGQVASWGRVHDGGSDDETGASERVSLFSRSKRAPYNPHYDPRSRRAAKVRQELFGY